MTVGDKCSRCNKCLKKKSINENWISKPVTEWRPRVKQHLVYDLDEDEKNDYEPYMSPLKKFFSDASVPCSMSVEIPWDKIAIPKRIRIRPDRIVDDQINLEEVDQSSNNQVESDESDPNIRLPWGKLVVTKTVPIKEPKVEPDAPLKIPWEDLLLESLLEIKPEKSEDEPCADENIEMPWEEILIPQNIKIKRQRPSIAEITTRSPVCKIKKTCCLKTKQMNKMKHNT